MSHIHCRVRNGKRAYRLWSTIVEAYLTDDLTYDEMLDEVRTDAIRSALRQLSLTLEGRMIRVHKNGTSDGFADPVPLDGPWARERSDEDE